MTGTTSQSTNLNDSRRNQNALEDVIKDRTFHSWGSLQIKYPNGTNVEHGNLLKPIDTVSRPTFKFILTDTSATINENDLFTLIMTDPDAPSRSDNFLSEICHMVQTDINFDSDGEMRKGKTIMPYLPCGPPDGSGKHRYVFLLYKQSNTVPSKDFTPVKSKLLWGYDTIGDGAYRWAQENKLTLIAVNHFQSEAPTNRFMVRIGYWFVFFFFRIYIRLFKNENVKKGIDATTHSLH